MHLIRLILILIVFAAGLSPQERKSPLTSQDVEVLIRDLPDARLAAEVRQRGIEPRLFERDLRRLRNSGAGPQTMAALAFFAQLSPLLIFSEPPIEGLIVSIGGQTSSTDSAGQVTINGLQPGRYLVSVEKPPVYPHIERWVSLAEGGSRQGVTLRVAPGKINILVEDARVEIRSVGSYNGPLRNLEVPAGTYAVSVSKVGHVTYTTSISVGPGEEKSLSPTLKREQVRYPVVHRHNWGRCSGMLVISDEIVAYQQSESPGKDSFEVPTTQISSVSQWSKNQFELVLKDGRKFHFAHGVLRAHTKDMAVMLEDIVDVRPVGPVIEAIRRVQQTGR